MQTVMMKEQNTGHCGSECNAKSQYSCGGVHLGISNVLFKIGFVQYVCTVSVTLSSMVGNLGWEEEGVVKRCIKEHIL